MTLRQLNREILLAKGFTEEEIILRGKHASSFAPDAPVDVELPPEAVEPLREALTEAFEAVQRNPEAVQAFLAARTARIVENN